MKKYDIRRIMKRAWEIKKQDERNMFPLCLKMAWKEEKAMNERKKFSGKEKVAVIEYGETNPCIGTEHDDPSNYFIFNMWEKYGKKRIYINDYKRRSVGYIDCDNNNTLVSEYSYGAVIETANYFRANYAF